MTPTYIVSAFLGMGLLSAQTLTINEVDADSPGADNAEFIELYSSTPNLPLDGYALVLFNGYNDNSYASYDLDGCSTDSNGYFVIGDSGVTGVMKVFSSSSTSNIQNGPDAVAIYQANKSDFPIKTVVTTINLIDAVVYGNDDADDTGLLTGLGKTVQYNENELSDASNHSLQRQSDGGFKTGTPSPNTSNQVLAITAPKTPMLHIYSNPALNTVKIDGLDHEVVFSIFSLSGQCVLSNRTNENIDVSRLANGFYMLQIILNGQLIRLKLIKH
jgi:hypothetical protein